MAPWFELTKSSDGQFRFSLKTDAATLLSSEGYTAKASAHNGIASVKTNAAQDAHYERKTASDGRPYFNLKAANTQIIGTSPMYADVAARDAAIAVVQAGAAAAEVRDNG
ncbi:MAG TPA: YegP family protein [Rubrivivax sp.]|nr:YegP family protein [Pseudomonadota bacterium]HOL37339.1 YegP family protein [Rubrivivax sp.]HPP82828.1 YegP family protein [Rubrivivax sp.]